jgi:hypothetical protein
MVFSSPEVTPIQLNISGVFLTQVFLFDRTVASLPMGHWGTCPLSSSKTKNYWLIYRPLQLTTQLTREQLWLELKFLEIC